MEFIIFGQRFYKGLRFDEMSKDFLEMGDVYESDGYKFQRIYRTRLFGVKVNFRIDFENGVIKELTIFDSTDNTDKDIKGCRFRILKEIFSVTEAEITEDEIMSLYEKDDIEIRDFSIGNDEFYIKINFKNGVPQNDVPVEHNKTGEQSNVPVEHHGQNTKTDKSAGFSTDTYETRGNKMNECIEYTEAAADVSAFTVQEIKTALDFFYEKTSNQWLNVTVSDGKMIFKLKKLNIRKFNEAVYESVIADELKKLILRTICGVHDYVLENGWRYYAGFTIEEISAKTKERDEAPAAYYSFEENTFSRKNNNFPKELTDKIICADSREFLEKLPDNCVDIILTAPPCDFNSESDIYSDCHTWDEYQDLMSDILAECIRVTKWGGRIIFVVKPDYRDNIPMHLILSEGFMWSDMIWKGEILWNKGKRGYTKPIKRSVRGPENPALRYNTEFLEIFCKGEVAKKGIKYNIDIYESDQTEWSRAQWEIPVGYSLKKYGHPDVFPAELAERALKLFSYKGDVVLDPFNGVGTTTAVAKRIGRRYLGIDISGEYCLTAKERLEEKQK